MPGLHGGVLLRRYREYASDTLNMFGRLLLSCGFGFPNPLPGRLLQRRCGLLDA